ncbi:hypothetical protein MTO96_045674, partial [Rhipicephalus appendiculatus]
TQEVAPARAPRSRRRAKFNVKHRAHRRGRKKGSSPTIDPGRKISGESRDSSGEADLEFEGAETNLGSRQSENLGSGERRPADSDRTHIGYAPVPGFESAPRLRPEGSSKCQVLPRTPTATNEK